MDISSKTSNLYISKLYMIFYTYKIYYTPINNNIFDFLINRTLTKSTHFQPNMKTIRENDSILRKIL